MTRVVALAVITSMLAGTARADDADVLGAPTPPAESTDVAAVVHLASSERPDRAHLAQPGAPDDASECDAPCTLRLREGEWIVSFERARVSATLTLRAPSSVVVEGRAGSDLLLWLGVGLAVAGAALLATALATDGPACFSGACEPEWVPVALGIGGVAAIAGLIIAIESGGEVHITPI